MSIMETMARGGCAILPVLRGFCTMLQSVRWNDGGFMAQRMAIWNVDLLPEAMRVDVFVQMRTCPPRDRGF